MKKNLVLIPLAAVAAMILSTGNSEARGENEIVRLAHSIQRQGAELKNEFQTHYTRSSAYRHLLTDANEVISKANHIDSLAHDPRTSYRHIKADLSELDNLVHHLHELVDDIERGRYKGYVDGGLGHVHAKVDTLNATIHSMDNALVAYTSPASGSCPTDRESRGGYSAGPRDWTNVLRPLFGDFLGRSASSRDSHDHGHSH